MPPKHDAGTATRHYRAFWQRRCRAAAAEAVLKPSGGNCAVLPLESTKDSCGSLPYILLVFAKYPSFSWAIPHNSKCRYGERGAADAVPQLPERCLSRKAGIVRCCPKNSRIYCILGPRLIFIVFLRVCFSFLNLPARLAGTRQCRVFVESHRANTACGNTVEVPARPTPWIRNLYLPPAPILPQPPHKNKTIKPSSQGAAGERAILF